MGLLYACVFLLFPFLVLVSSEDLYDSDVEETLRVLLTPQENPSIQVQALRKEVMRRLMEALDRAELEDDLNYKRSVSSLAHWNNLPYNKRNVEALARAGYIKTLPEDEEDDNPKRSLDGDDKDRRSEEEKSRDSKRGIESLARNGELHGKREVQKFLNLYEKRNLASLARNYNFPYEKRFVGTLARSGDLSRFYPQNQEGKRNIQSLARDGSRFTGGQDNNNGNDKRNLASLKAQYKQKFKRSTTDHDRNRNKRQADYFYDEEDFAPYLQSMYDYEDLLRTLDADSNNNYPTAEKRFLGSVARSGWFRPNTRNYRELPEKRHIGSLARIGWLPSFRATRRFNRSGRSTDLGEDTCREATSDGQTKDDYVSSDVASHESLGQKRFLLQPAVDQIILKKILSHPRSH